MKPNTATRLAWRFASRMAAWYSKPLGDGIVSTLPCAQIDKAFRELSAASGNPADMAVFTRYDSEGRLQCEVTAYFSPAATAVARMFAAEPCAKPARAGLDLLAGDQRCWSALFPEQEK